MGSSLWVARNKEGDLWLFSKKPWKGYEDKPFREIWCCSTITSFCIFGIRHEGCVLQLKDEMFPEVTYENSPIELVINKLK